MWKDEKKISPALEIPYFPWHAKNEQSYTLTSKWRYTRFEFNFEELDNDLKIMSEFIEPFLVALSQFLPEEERKKLPTPSEKTSHALESQRRTTNQHQNRQPFRYRVMAVVG